MEARIFRLLTSEATKLARAVSTAGWKIKSGSGPPGRSPFSPAYQQYGPANLVFEKISTIVMHGVLALAGRMQE